MSKSQSNKKYLVVIAGPTGIGKTKLSLALAEHFSTEIISADSRQFYKELIIGTATPSPSELNRITHHFINHKSITENYNVGEYESEAIQKLEELFNKYDLIILTGGSGLFINAVIYGLDSFPEIPPEIRKSLQLKFEQEGLSWVQHEVFIKDPEYFSQVDQSNPQRLLRALEVCIATGKPFSSFKSGITKQRSFDTINILLNENRKKLYDKINQRVELMIEAGLVQEVKTLLPFKDLNALNTVGYKELFDYLEGKISLEQSIELIKQNSRRYAKRQLTWFRKNQSYHVFEPDQLSEIKELINRITLSTENN